MASLSLDAFEERISNRGVNDLSSQRLSAAEKDVLGFNLKYIPPSTRTPILKELQKDEDVFKKKLFLQVIFQKEKQKREYIKSLSSKSDASFQTTYMMFMDHTDSYFVYKAISALKMVYVQENLALLDNPLTKYNRLHNLNKNSRSFNLTLRSLLENHNWTFKAAEKNLGLVIMDTPFYENEVKKMLDDSKTYEIVSEEQVKLACVVIRKKTKDIIQFYRNNGATDTETNGQILKFLVRQETKRFSLPCFYCLPKIHKNPTSFRPIVPSHNWITSSFSKILSFYLQQICLSYTLTEIPDYSSFTEESPSIIKDSKSLVQLLEKFTVQDKDCLFITSDITSLYTNIPIEMGIQTIDTYTKLQPKNWIIYMLKIVLQNNFFRFNDTFFRQK